MPDLDRARSFMERYVIARAPLFRAGYEEEDAWKATLDAKTVYRNIYTQSRDADQQEGAGVSRGRWSPAQTQAQDPMHHPVLQKMVAMDPSLATDPGRFQSLLKAITKVLP